MDTDLILIAKPSSQALEKTLVEEVSTAIGAHQPNWLAEGEACEWPLPGLAPGDHGELETIARKIVGDRPVDIAVVPTPKRRKRLLIADMDSTIIGQECIDELAAAGGVGDEVKAVTERAMRGELEFEDALRGRVAKLAGLPAGIIDELIANAITVNDGAACLVETMKSFGAMTALVSGGFVQFARHVAGQTGFEHVQANSLVIENETLKGTVEEPILGRDAKLKALRSLCETHGLELDEAIAVGDGANDLAMIEAAGIGVAYHAKPALREAADVRIDHGDLTALLYIQGYPRRDFRC